jgi:hypothetical protein
MHILHTCKHATEEEAALCTSVSTMTMLEKVLNMFMNLAWFVSSAVLDRQLLSHICKAGEYIVQAVPINSFGR